MKLIPVSDKKKKTQYIIAGIISIIILMLWITLPLTNKSVWDSSVSNPYGMTKKSADLSLMDSAGIDAPGAPLTGELIDNPATTLDLEASSLFKMPESESIYEESKDANKTQGGLADALPNPPSPNPSKSDGFVKSKLNKLSSLAGGNSGSMTVGTTHNKFFGQDVAKADLVGIDDNKFKSSSDGKNVAFMALKYVEDQSVKAKDAKDTEQSRGSATSAFEKTKQVDTSYLNSKEEKEASASGLELSKAEMDFKRNDPSISHKKITLPTPKEDEDESKKMEEEIKKMLLQMIIQATVGQVFGVIGQMMAMNMCPQCYGQRPK